MFFNRNKEKLNKELEECKSHREELFYKEQKYHNESREYQYILQKVDEIIKKYGNVKLKEEWESLCNIHDLDNDMRLKG